MAASDPNKTYTLGGQLQSNSTTQLTEILSKWPDNEELSAIVIGALVDNALTQGNMGSHLQFEGAMGELQMQLTTQLEELKTANQLQLIDAEGQMAGDLIDKQMQGLGQLSVIGSGNKINEMNAAGQIRLNEISAQGANAINLANVNSTNAIKQIGAKGDITKDLQEQKGRLDQELTRVKGDEGRQTIAAQGFQNRELARVEGKEKLKQISATGDQSVRLENTKGDNQRKNDQNKREQEQMLRTDARGQTGRQGAKFFG